MVGYYNLYKAVLKEWERAREIKKKIIFIDSSMISILWLHLPLRGFPEIRGVAL